MSIAYFLGTRLLDTSVSPADPHAHSIALFCQSCGDIWFRAIVEHGRHWDCHHAVCERHISVTASNWNRTPGTVGLGDSLTLPRMSWALAVDKLPLSVLEREFLLEYDNCFKESP
jgi:hypothetical protein